MKKTPSKLDQFAETLLQMDGEKKTLAQMVEWLKGEGCTTSFSNLSTFLSSLRQEKLEQQLFGLIASGARMSKELDSAFEQNPEPDIEQLIKVTKSLVLSLQLKGAADSKLLNLANSMQQTVLAYMAARTKAELEKQKIDLQERRVVLLEQKAAAYDRAQAALTEAKNSKGGITPETLERIERELKLL